MQKLKIAALALVVLTQTTWVLGQTPRVYPGAKLDTAATEQAKKLSEGAAQGTQSSIYVTADSFKKVYAFYKGIGKEYQMPSMSKGKLPTGQEMKQAFFIFDGAKDLTTSKSWVTVQRPYIGSVEMKSTGPEYHDISDVTAIVVVQKK